ncbi:MAG: putative cell wall binding protein [Chloroflexi bacterium]|nr:putative cell wall binding protein [Chloroflexota bacterium]
MFTFARREITRGLILSVLACSALTFGLARPSHAATTSGSAVVALPGYTVSVWAKGTGSYNHPDSVVTDGTHVFVGYQNVTAKDGSDDKYSTVVEYAMDGTSPKTFRVLGHNDGLRIDPVTKMVWAASNEDGNPRLTTINPTTGATTLYKFPTPPHGGGYDDLAFAGGMAFIDASNPTLNAQGVNVFPALDKITLVNGAIQLTPVLMGNATAVDSVTKKTVTLNLVDPDSMTFDPKGNLVLDNQAGSQLVFIHGAGTAHQTVRALSIGNQVDDSVWATSAHGHFLMTDTGANSVYSVSATFVPGTLYAAMPNDSGVAGLLGTISESKGIISPVAIGFVSPHGMAFVPGM